MADREDTCREETIRIGDAEIVSVRGGRGAPLLVLHEELGHPGWLRWHRELAATREILVPLHPGFGRSARLDWIRSVRDLACFYGRWLHEQRLAPIDAVGFSFGGWIAAEMAANDPALFRRLVLVAPVGIRPDEGEILDFFPITARESLEASVRDPRGTPEFASLYGGASSPEQFEAWEDARTETARIAWAPYLHNPSLPHLLEAVNGVATLVVWGRDDRIVPASAARIWQRSIRGASLEVLDGCGHRPEIEQTRVFVERVKAFLSA